MVCFSPFRCFYFYFLFSLGSAKAEGRYKGMGEMNVIGVYDVKFTINKKINKKKAFCKTVIFLSPIPFCSVS